MVRVIRLPSVPVSREIFSLSSVPPWLNMSSKACRRAASMSLTASPLDLSAALTWSARAPISSAKCALLSMSASPNCCERPAIFSMVTAAFWGKPDGHHLLQAGGELVELLLHVLGLEGETSRQLLAGRGDGRAGLVAGGFQAVEQSRATVAQGVDHRIAGMAERQRDVFALVGERAGDALRHLVDLVGHQVADR